MDILSIGDATVDVFLRGANLQAKRDEQRHLVEEFRLGSKLPVEEVHFSCGGNALNSAVTFARQGLKVGFAGKIGHDLPGRQILEVLRTEGINTDNLLAQATVASGYSTILLATNGERTILNYRGANSALAAGEFQFEKMTADWFYISPLGGNLNLLSRILGHAKKQGIKTAINPGLPEIQQGERFKSLLDKIDVLLANREELTQLFAGDNYRSLLKAASAVTPMVVMTDGPKGAYATDSNNNYFIPPFKDVPVIDRTGAGDAFGSGLISVLARGGTLPEALSFGSANATGVIGHIGSQTGILKSKWSSGGRIKVSVL